MAPLREAKKFNERVTKVPNKRMVLTMDTRSKRSLRMHRADTVPSGMQGKLSQKERFFGKPWKNRSKVIPNAGNSLWAAEKNCVWTSMGGRKVILQKTQQFCLSEPERLALQQIALTKLRKMDLKSHVTIPKESQSVKKSLKRAISLKSKVIGISFFDKEKESGVFAIPLSRAVSQNLPVGQSSQSPTANCKPGQTAKDETRKSQKLHGANETTTTPICNNNESPRTRRHSSTSSVSQVSSKSSSDINPKQTVASNQENEVTANGPPESPNWKSRLIDALTLLSSSASASCLIDREATLLTLPPQVPPIVLEAIEHLELYGIHVLGIFRIAGSKKRMKQMREGFDSGEKTKFTEDDNPHDVAALFKEYLRDLPEPLLTRELYAAFLESQNQVQSMWSIKTRKEKMRIHMPYRPKFEDNETQIKVLKLLSALLPVPNRDTLKVLLEFLAKVHYWSDDRVGKNGEEVPGNKMMSRNLATLIGPNILHKIKGSQHHDYLVEDMARAEERKEVIDVVQDMIDNYQELFEISAEDYHEIMENLLENEPEIMDYILRRKAPCRTSIELPEDVFFENSSDGPKGRSYDDGDRNLMRAASAPHSYNEFSMMQRSMSHSPDRSTQEAGHGDSSPRLLRQRSSPAEGPAVMGYAHDPFRDHRRRTPPTYRPRRFLNPGENNPPSPGTSSTSHSISLSNYSTPPSSPSSTPFVSAESGSSSPDPGLSYYEGHSPVSELATMLTEVESEMAFQPRNPVSIEDLQNYNFSEWQLEQWLKWESLARRNSSQRDVLEQETLV